MDLVKGYRFFRGQNEPATRAISLARAEVNFDLLEDEGLVRLRWVDDSDGADLSYIDDWKGTPRQRAHWRKSAASYVETHGNRGCVVEFVGRDGSWEHADSCWGYVLDDREPYFRTVEAGHKAECLEAMMVAYGAHSFSDLVEQIENATG